MGLGDSTTNQFKIKVSQLSCNSPNVAQLEKCFQYFTGVTGTVNSYNYAGTQMIAGHQYTNCIRQEADHCCIQWSQYSTTTFKVAGGPRTNAANSAIACAGIAAATLCSDGVGCTRTTSSFPTVAPPP